MHMQPWNWTDISETPLSQNVSEKSVQNSVTLNTAQQHETPAKETGLYKVDEMGIPRKGQYPYQSLTASRKKNPS